MLTIENKKVIYVRECDGKKLLVYEITENDNVDFDDDNESIIEQLRLKERFDLIIEIDKVSKDIQIRDGFGKKIVYSDVQYKVCDYYTGEEFETFEKNEEITITFNETEFLIELKNDDDLLYRLACEKCEYTTYTDVLVSEYLYIK
ncbi:hypothetical protein O3794_02780 [Gemella sanguinis]|uniref:hypothetical protein n=1 Tax=Gemella sanguinis TaxID=84135 RepID=UPI00352CA1C1